MYFGGFSGGTAFDPNEIADTTYVPPVVFTDFQLAGSSVGVGRGSPLKRSISYSQSITLSHTQSTFALEFASLSYPIQSTTRFRHKLEPLDLTWHELGIGQRLVPYNRLSTGNYTFRVQSATSRGPWSEPGASLQIEVLPPWWSTFWFRLICFVLVLLSLYAAYSYRVGQIAGQFEVRLEERVSERTRLARELHDTLLQSFQGSLFEFQAGRNLLSRRPEEAVHTLDDAIRSAEAAIAEGRDAIQDLRSGSTVGHDLAHLFSCAGRELSNAQASNGNGPEFRVTVEGTPRALSPVLQDELYRIGMEVLRNAFRHSRAKRIEVEIRYAAEELRLRIRDDGIGIDPKVLNAGARPGHWGLQGVRERAKLAGAQLDFWSEADAGTEVQIKVPAAVAHATPRRTDMFRFFRKKITIHAD
jgi:signal transduction histidine kinase